MKKVKILYFVDRMLKGGIQSLLIGWVTNLDRKKFDIDVLLLDDGNEYELENTLKKLNCNVYKLNGVWVRKPTDFIKYGRALNLFFKEHHNYKVVHLNSSSKNYLVLKYAKKFKIPIRIAHSHNTNFQTKNKIKRIIGELLKIKLLKYATDYVACSELAGEWLFGKRIVKNSNRFKVIHNGIDYNKFKYNKSTREQIRKQLGFTKNDFIIGCVGRFEEQKNHKFLIKVFNEIYKINNNSKLLLIGKGSKQTEIQRQAEKMNLDNKVKFIGFKENVNDYLNAMDVFCMPSLYEGLGLVLIEAQANGLPCYTSTNVPIEAKVSSQIEFISLKKNEREWADIIINGKKNRQDTYEEIKNSKYFIEDCVRELEKIYLK